MDKTAKDRRYRNKKRNGSVTDRNENVTVSPESVTESLNSVTVDVTQYPAILQALTDPTKRRKLEKIYQSLRDFKQEKNVFYGYPDRGVPFDLVGELLEIT